MNNMFETNPSSEGKIIDVTIKLLLTISLLTWCVMILVPFLMPILWGIILAITLYPVYQNLLRVFKGKKALASTVLTLVLLLVLIIPFVWLIASVVDSAKELMAGVRNNTLTVPPPNPKVADWYIIGEPLYGIWRTLNANLEAAILKYSEQFIRIGDKFLGAVKSVTSNFLLLVVSIIISGIMLASTEKSQRSAKGFAARLIGGSGEDFISMIVLTIRNVAKGILGVAFIQFVLCGASFILADIPFAGLWALLVLLFAIVQLPVGIIGIPVVVYLFSAREPLPAILWSILILVFSMSDNVLKPWLMGKGAPVPMLIIFLGAIGGMMMSGFIGLFTGAIILSIGYKLVIQWLGEEVKSL